MCLSNRLEEWVFFWIQLLERGVSEAKLPDVRRVLPFVFVLLLVNDGVRAGFSENS